MFPSLKISALTFFIFLQKRMILTSVSNTSTMYVKSTASKWRPWRGGCVVSAVWLKGERKIFVVLRRWHKKVAYMLFVKGPTLRVYSTTEVAICLPSLISPDKPSTNHICYTYIYKEKKDKKN
jgi:hypothetical protein